MKSKNLKKPNLTPEIRKVEIKPLVNGFLIQVEAKSYREKEFKADTLEEVLNFLKCLNYGHKEDKKGKERTLRDELEELREDDDED